MRSGVYSAIRTAAGGIGAAGLNPKDFETVTRLLEPYVGGANNAVPFGPVLFQELGEFVGITPDRTNAEFDEALLHIGFAQCVRYLGAQLHDQ